VIERDALDRVGRAALPVVAILVFVGSLAATLAVAGDTLGYDFRAYHQAIVRLFSGQPLYDMSYTTTGGFGLFYYPPTFAPLLIPFAFLAEQVAVAVWIGLSVAAFLLGVAVLPVSRNVRWWTLLLAGLSFPFVYGIKLGQVGAVLFMLMAIGWRWLDGPIRLGASGALGAAIKLQPGLVLGWALLTRRFRAVGVGIVVLAVLAAAATLMAGVGAWGDFLTLVRTVSDPIATPQNLTPGAVAFQLGVAPATAAMVQVASTVGVVVVVLVAIRWGVDEASYLTTVVATQLVSPILWNHYATLLLLPVAYLLSAGRWWAALIPLVTAWPLVGVTPPVAYPLVFWATLLVVTIVGIRARRGVPPEPVAPAIEPDVDALAA
jgi:alpha-1,2-mannosyltransferase